MDGEQRGGWMIGGDSRPKHSCRVIRLGGVVVGVVIGVHFLVVRACSHTHRRRVILMASLICIT